MGYGGDTRQLAVKQEVAALTMEEVAPVAFSARDHTAPQEAFKGGSLAGKKAAGDVKGTTELTQVRDEPCPSCVCVCVCAPLHCAGCAYTRALLSSLLSLLVFTVH